MFARSTIVNLRRRQCIVKRRSIVLPSVKQAPLLARCYLGEALFFFMPAQGTVRAVQFPSLWHISVHFRPNNRDEQKSPQQTMLSEICLPNRRELLSALVIEMVIKTSFNQSTIGQKRNRKKCAGEDFPTSSILLSFLSDSGLVYFARCLTQPFSILETI